MHQINTTIKQSPVKGLNINKLASVDASEILLITLEKESVFPTHTSKTDATLIVLEGAIMFHINNTAYELSKHDILSFKKDEAHWVKANANSKFLIIR